MRDLLIAASEEIRDAAGRSGAGDHRPAERREASDSGLDVYRDQVGHRKRAEERAAEAEREEQRAAEREEQRKQLLAIQEELRRVREAKLEKVKEDGGADNDSE